MTITLNGTTGITTPDVNVTAQSSNIVTTGNITAVDATLSGGVYVGGTAAANYLDDYEEGTWAPTFGGGAVNPSITYIEQTGRYTKIGNIVRFSFSVQWSSQSGGSGAWRIYLPFATNSGAAWQGDFQIGYQNGATVLGSNGYCDPGQSSFFIKRTDSATVLLDINHIGASGHVIGGGTFEVA